MHTCSGRRREPNGASLGLSGLSREEGGLRAGAGREGRGGGGGGGRAADSGLARSLWLSLPPAGRADTRLLPLTHSPSGSLSLPLSFSFFPRGIRSPPPPPPRRVVAARRRRVTRRSVRDSRRRQRAPRAAHPLRGSRSRLRGGSGSRARSPSLPRTRERALAALGASIPQPRPGARLRTGPGWSLPPDPAPGAPLGVHPSSAFSRPRRGSGPGGSLQGLRQPRVRASASLRLSPPTRHTPPPSARQAQRRRAFHLPGGSHLGLQIPAKRGWRGGISDSREAR